MNGIYFLDTIITHNNYRYSQNKENTYVMKGLHAKTKYLGRNFRNFRNLRSYRSFRNFRNFRSFRINKTTS